MSSEEISNIKFGMSKIPTEEGIDIKDYDSNITTLYKLSHHIGTPIDYIYLEGNYKGNYNYTTVMRFINSKVKEGEKLENYYLDIHEKFPNLRWKDLAIFYYDYITKLTDRLSKQGTKEQRKQNANLINPENMLKNINAMFLNIKESNKDYEEELEEFKDVDSLEEEYEKWNKQYKLKMAEQEVNYDKINTAQEELDKIRGVKYYPPVIESETYVFHPILSESKTKPTLEEGVEIFQKAIVSENVLYIQYNSVDGRNLYWIYNDIKKNKINPPSNYLDHITQSTRMNTIYILYWIGEKGKISNKNLIKFIYYIDSGEFILKSPKKDGGYKKIKKDLEDSFPNLIFGKGEQTKVQGYFEVEDVSFDNLSYYYTLNTDMTHKLYLYVEESARVFADKQRPNIHYRSIIKNSEDIGSFASVTISFGQFVAEDDDDLFIPESAEAFSPSTKEISGKLRVNIVKAESKNVLEQFQIVFSKLLAKYRYMKADVESFIGLIIPEFGSKIEDEVNNDSDDENVKTPKKQENCEKETINKILKKKAPDIFVSGYARSCQCGKQPLIVKPDEVEEWRNYTFTKGKNVEKRQVMPYPPLKPEGEEYDDPLTLDPYDERVRLWIVCPKNELHYPSLKKSMTLNNRDKFPYIPCCGNSDSISDTKSEYYNYWDKNQLNKGPEKVNHNMSTMKILRPPGRKAKLDKTFSRLLSGYNTVKDKEIVFQRCGVPVSYNSLIHCVLLAITDKGYNRLRKDSDKEIYVRKVREYINNSINPLLFKQELYDNSLEEIKSDLENQEIDFASEKYYRSLEEIFDINIFVFTVKSGEERRNEEEEEFSIEIPRSKICHVRPYRENKRSVIIIKHWGTEINELKNPHCELLVSNLEEIADKKEKSKKKFISKDEDTTFIFESNMTKILYQVLVKSYQVYVWSYPEDIIGKISSDSIMTRINPFSRIDWELLFNKYQIVGQRVDGYGKLRTIGIKIAKNKTVAIFIPPSQPLNLPYLDDISPVKEKYVLEIFGKPSAIEENGLYYSVLDYKYGIYIPTIPEKTISLPSMKKVNVKNKPTSEMDIFSVIKSYGYDKFEMDIKDGQKRIVTPNIPNPPIVEEMKKDYPVNVMRIAKRNTYYLVQIISWLKSLDISSSIEDW